MACVSRFLLSTTIPDTNLTHEMTHKISLSLPVHIRYTKPENQPLSAPQKQAILTVANLRKQRIKKKSFSCFSSLITSLAEKQPLLCQALRIHISKARLLLTTLLTPKSCILYILKRKNSKGDKIVFYYDYGRGKSQRPSTGIFVYTKP